MGTIIDESTLTPEELKRAEGFAMGQCRPEIAAMILRRAGLFASPEPVKKEKAKPRKTDEKKSLRDVNSKLVRAIAFATGREHAHINSDLNRAVGINSIAAASIDQLRQRIKAAEAIAKRVGAEA